MPRTSRSLALLAVLLLSAATAAAQPQLNFKRIVNNWPTVELYFSVACNGQAAYFTDKSHFKVYENDIEVGAFDLWCPDVSSRCAISVSLVFDASGSMQGSGNAGAKAAGNAFVDMMDGVIDQAAVLWFTSVVTMAQGMTTNRDLLHGAINALPANGATAVWDGMYFGLLELINNGVNPCRAMIVMTDGGDNSSSRSPSEIISLANRNRIRIFTIGLGSGIQSEILKNIADLTGGVYYETPNPAQLTAIYEAIATNIFASFKECIITYQATCMDGGFRKVDLSLVNFCSGSDTKTKTYKAPKDTSTYQPLNLRIGSASARAKTDVTVPIQLLTPFDNSLFSGATFSIQFDPSCLQFKDIKAPPGSVLAGVPITTIPAGDMVSFQSMSKKLMSVQTVPATLAELTFKASDPQGLDTVHCPVKFISWVFEAGCFRPVLQNGMISIAPRQPRLECVNAVLPNIRWDTAAAAYTPASVLLTGEVLNTGDGDAEGVRMTLLRDTLDFTLVSPAMNTQSAGPDPILPGDAGSAQWQIGLFPRLAGDSVRLSFRVTADNFGPWLCERKLWIPASKPTVRFPASRALCGSDSVELQSLPGYAKVVWSTGATAASIFVNSPGTYFYTATDMHGNSGLSDTVNIVRHPSPTPVLTQPGPITLCAGFRTQLGTTQPYAAYAWSTGETTSSITVSKAGVYFVTVMDSNGCMSATAPVTVSVVPGPSADIRGVTGACTNSPGEYAVLRSAHAGYFWTLSGGSISSGQNADTLRVLWGRGNSGMVVVGVTDSVLGCTRYDTVRVTLYASPAPVLAVSGSTQLCEGDSVTLDAGAAFKSYLWSNGRTGRSIIVRSPGNYFVRAENAFGCYGNSDTVAVTVTTKPAPRIFGPLTVCRGSDVVYSTNRTPSNPVQWQVTGGTILQGEFDSDVTVRWGAGGSASIRVTETNGACAGTRIDSVVLSTSVKPSIVVQGGLTLCQGDTVTLDAGDGYTTYQWTNGFNTRTIRVAQSGSYAVYVETAAGCKGTSDSVTVRVHPLPVEPVINRTGDRLHVVARYSTYQWLLGGTDIPGANSSTHVAMQPGLYSITITDSNGCTATSQPFLVGTLSAEALAPPSMQLDLYPDPNRGIATLRIGAQTGRALHCTVTDQLGRVLLRQSLDVQSTPANITLDLTALPPGVYTLRLDDGSRSVYRNFVRM
ncbi:MAG: VWA domain-containing protein [Ignavibacteria bacterium]|nr:VWA domain-containing protein [Ignavibacteria bacterium]